MDFRHPPRLIDCCYRAILNVRDLASHQQLLWLAVEQEDAATVMEALGAWFTEHGPPLVKCDNGRAFRACATKALLLDWGIFTLYSPPYRAWYNASCERANRTLKELTAHLADQAGRPGFWTSDDLLAARLRANRLSRPWGALGCRTGPPIIRHRQNGATHRMGGTGPRRAARGYPSHRAVRGYPMGSRKAAVHAK